MLQSGLPEMRDENDEGVVIQQFNQRPTLYLSGERWMDTRKRNENLVLNEKLQFNELIKRIIPNPKLICIKFSDESSMKNGPGRDKKLGHCDVIEIITQIPISTKNLNKLFREVGYILFDTIYEQDRLHFFIRKAGERET
jgi:hypothetical protein